MADDERLVTNFRSPLSTETCSARLDAAGRAPSPTPAPTPSTSAGLDGGADGWTPREGRLRTTAVAAAGAARTGDARRIERFEQCRLALDEQLEGGGKAFATVGRSPCVASSFQVRTPGRSALVSGTRPSPPPTASVYSRPLSLKTIPPGVNGAWPTTSRVFGAIALKSAA
jgi:hypothetical protein